MLKVDQATLTQMEVQYPGIAKTIMKFEETEFPSCPHCESTNTSVVQAGIIGRTIYLATATTKVKLVPNRSEDIGYYFCHECSKYFN